MKWQGFDPVVVSQWEPELVPTLPGNLGSSCVVEWAEHPELAVEPDPDYATLARSIREE